MRGEPGLFASLGGTVGGIYSCDVNIAEVLLLLSLSSGTKMFSYLRA